MRSREVAAYRLARLRKHRMHDVEAREAEQEAHRMRARTPRVFALIDALDDAMRGEHTVGPRFSRLLQEHDLLLLIAGISEVGEDYDADVRQRFNLPSPVEPTNTTEPADDRGMEA